MEAPSGAVITEAPAASERWRAIEVARRVLRQGGAPSTPEIRLIAQQLLRALALPER